MPRTRRAVGLFVVLAHAVIATACKPQAGAESTDAAVTPSASAASVVSTATSTAIAPPSAPVVSAVHPTAMTASPHASASAQPSSTASAVTAAVECRAKNADGPIELDLSWDKDLAKGTLKSTKAGKAVSVPVVAQLYKGLVLVDVPGTKNLTGAVATVTTEGKKTIRLGDYKQPTFDCQ